MLLSESVDVSGVTTVKVLNALDALDRHSFERVDANNSLDTLYTKIFPAAYPNPKESPTNQEETRVQYVCISTEYMLSLRSPQQRKNLMTYFFKVHKIHIQFAILVNFVS